MKDIKRLTLTTLELQTLRRWLEIVQLEEPFQGAWIRDASEFVFMVKLRKKILKMLERHYEVKKL